MVQLLTWEWLARDIMFQLADGRSIGLPWRRSERATVYWMSRQTTGMEKRIRTQGGIVQEQDGCAFEKKSHGCGSNKKDEQMDGHEVGIEIGLLEKALVQFTASIPLTLFVSTSGLKKEFKAKREIDPVFPCHAPPPLPYLFSKGGGGPPPLPHLCFPHFL